MSSDVPIGTVDFSTIILN